MSDGGSDILNESKCFTVRLPDERRGIEACEYDVCGPLGGSLWCPRGANENEAVNSWLQASWKFQTKDDVAMLGMYSCRSEGEWRWTGKCTSMYRDWAKDEPGNDTGEEDCSSITTKFDGWHSEECAKNNRNLYCICEHDLERASSFEEDVCKCSAVWTGVDDCATVISIIWTVWTVIAAVAAATILFDKINPESPSEQTIIVYGGMSTVQLRQIAESAIAIMVCSVLLWSIAFSTLDSDFIFAVTLIHILMHVVFAVQFMRLLGKLYGHICKGICLGIGCLITPFFFLGLGNFGFVVGWALYTCPICWIHFQMKRKAMINCQLALHPVSKSSESQLGTASASSDLDTNVRIAGDAAAEIRISSPTTTDTERRTSISDIKLGTISNRHVIGPHDGSENLDTGEGAFAN